jgi:CheY-like chemotaxis protein
MISYRSSVCPGRRLILAHLHAGFVAKTCAHFRQLGWEVFTAQSAAEARRLAIMVRPDVVILDTDLPDESGWLVCDKITREEPAPEVVLVSEKVTPRRRRLAAFVGASALAPRCGARSLVRDRPCLSR